MCKNYLFKNHRLNFLKLINLNKQIFLFLIICAFVNSNSIIAQSALNVSKLAKQGEKLIEKEEWSNAYQIFDSIVKSGEKNPFFMLKQGICGIHLPGKKKETIAVLEKAYQASPDDHIILYYLGRAYHHDYQFESANSNLDKYLSYHENDPVHTKEAEMYKAFSLNGNKLINAKGNAKIQNIGSPVNTSEDEYVPVITADESQLFFTYRGKQSIGGKQNSDFIIDQKNGSYYEDIYYSKTLSNNSWGKPKSIEKDINTKFNDACIALSPDGQELYTFYSDDDNEGDIHKCVLKGDMWTAPAPLNENINSKAWEGSCSISADGRFLFFSSERPDGFGKKDIYVSSKDENGEWGPAKNLGPTINTEDNEDDPFISSDGTLLFFSSDGHKSIGGFDVMYSIYKDAKWQDAQNMGMPLNTTDDDRYFVINAKGDKGYFSSNRDSKNKPNQDIFTITTNFENEKPILALIKGKVFGNNKPIGSNIEIVRKINNNIIGPFHSNSKTGNYLVTLSQNETYVFTIKAEGYEVYTEEFTVPILNVFTEVKKDFHLYKKDYLAAKKSVDTTLNELFSKKIIASNNNQEIKKSDEQVALTNNKSSSESKNNELKKNEVTDETSKNSTFENATFNLHFDYDQSLVKTEEQELKKLMEFLNNNQNYRLIITGHTDERGSETYNQSLSVRRANAVKNLLLNNKVKLKSVSQTIGKGESDLLEKCPSENCDETLHSKNRRVEVKVMPEPNL